MITAAMLPLLRRQRDLIAEAHDRNYDVTLAKHYAFFMIAYSEYVDDLTAMEVISSLGIGLSYTSEYNKIKNLVKRLEHNGDIPVAVGAR